MEDFYEPPRKRPAIKLEKRLIVVLERASLESVKVGKEYQLLNCDRHKGIAKKFKRDISTCRPDITHQCLLMLMDSPLNRAGLLQVFIRTEKNILIEINPQTRIPRTFDRFCGLMVQLLQKFSIHALDGNVKLLKVIKNPITDHFPNGCMKIGTSFSAEVVQDPTSVMTSTTNNDDDDAPIVFVVGAISRGSIDVDYVEKTISLSSYPLSAALTCAKLCGAFERRWNVL
ncbi:hypothetical protein HELRODRAFT_90376 [Helobdella robusta]|uniref:Ribosomal RNA small subunit methyltransferase NEP1 n=1 Tax=Helobdella robusta TaxID=6412 RepID=T1G7Q2_HELRO|nr:hypothetical protein HELRODRAFT_90376 [Helobdella robusta]ESN91170.1 hypothetical protein HELRODRAFT_90376 [Helobdella robusta]